MHTRNVKLKHRSADCRMPEPCRMAIVIYEAMMTSICSRTFSLWKYRLHRVFWINL